MIVLELIVVTSCKKSVQLPIQTLSIVIQTCDRAIWEDMKAEIETMQEKMNER